MTVTPTGPLATATTLDGVTPPKAKPSRTRWLYIAVLLLVGLTSVASVIVWPLYGTAAAVVVAVVIAIVHICRS